MDCKSCKESIPSKFKFAVETNACPMCGGEIMEVALWKILKDLKTTMEEAKPYMEEVEDWLFNNYSIGKSKKQKSNKSDTEDVEISDAGIFDSEMDEETIRKQTELAKQKMAGFQQRAGVPKQNTGLKSVVNQIKAASGSADISEFIGVDPDYGPIDMSKEISTPLNSEEQHQMQSMINAQYSIKETEQEKAIKEYYELQKIKKFQEQQKTGPKFSRNSE